MASGTVEPTSICHVVAMPHPGRGHINPMLNLCKLLAAEAGSRILVSFVLTQEWAGFLGSEPRPHNLRFVSIPNVVPSELVRAADMVGFLEAAWTKIEAPFDRLLDTDLLDPPPTLIIADTYSGWAVGVGNRRNIPVASFWPMSSSMFSYFHHFHLLGQNGHFPINLQGEEEKGDEVVEYIPGICATKLSELSMVNGKNLDLLERFVKQVTFVPNAQYLLLTTIYELEPQAVDALKPKLSLPIYTVGPAIPYFNLGDNDSSITNDRYFQWLGQQPRASVLYVSLGSYLSASSAQMDELAAGLRDSGVRFLWSVRGEASRLSSSDMGLVVPWCDQLRVLSHSSIGGFLSHCGWSSVREGLFCGVPFLTFPLAIDQYLNGKMIVEDWKVGWRLKKCGGAESVVTCREEIAGAVQRFMDLEDGEGREMRKRGKQLEEVCQNVVAKGGSSENGIGSFISNILKL